MFPPDGLQVIFIYLLTSVFKGPVLYISVLRINVSQPRESNIVVDHIRLLSPLSIRLKLKFPRIGPLFLSL